MFQINDIAELAIWCSKTSSLLTPPIPYDGRLKRKEF